ncbi:MAG TPA: hypothetical protein VNJ28_05475 [Candidatus Limnocylindrales bacterium]|jgi:hypothetical protein|nr:hypothetical protein [Candidatus Limnocylindrales bacterium]
MTRLLRWLGGIGTNATDDIDTGKRKALLVHVAVLILPISLLWGVLYLKASPWAQGQANERAGT